MIERAKFTYSSLKKNLQTKTIEDQEEKQIKAFEEHRKQLVQSSSVKEPSTHLKEKEIFEELAYKIIDEIQNLSKQINFNNLL